MAGARILIASHSHPHIAKGGAEISAHALYSALAHTPGIDAWFLGCARSGHSGRLGAAIAQPFGEREFVYSSGAFDWFRFANHDPCFPKEMRVLLRDLRPDVVHFHHYINFGVEVFQLIRRSLPDARIVLTLHEYLAICHHYGQMVTTGRHSLCPAATFARCNHCFPEHAPADFFLRKNYIMQFLEFVDHFISPSAFLAQRYVDWGIAADRISVIDNILPASRQAVPAQSSRDPGDPLHIAFFGQISWLKGCDVIFDAADILLEAGCDDIVFDIHGDYRNQMPEFQKAFLRRLKKAGRNVAFHGPYENEHVDTLMTQADAVLVPSVWWENSPVVIQEALRNRRPVLCSDIGGMAEKVRHGIDGFHFRAGSGAALSALLRRLAADRSILASLDRTTLPPSGPQEALSRHLAVYSIADRSFEAR